MNNKNLKDKSLGRIEFSEKRIPKKKTAQSNPFARITLHPLEELEPRDVEVSGGEGGQPGLPTLYELPSQHSDPLSSLTQLLSDDSTNPTNLDGIPSLTRLPSQPTLPNDFREASKSTGKITQFPVSPERDFQKVPNSTTRVALAQGLFKGKSKQIYDYLWSVSRGSINPTRMVRKTRMEIKAGAGLGSKNTLDSGLAHLEKLGLITVKIESGSLLGNEYEVFTIEEAGLPTLPTNTGLPTLPTLSGLAGLPENTQKLGSLANPISGEGGEAQTVENKGIYEQSKTFFKTKREEIDDERFRAAFGEFAKVLEETLKKHTGQGINPNDKIKWKHVGEVLAAQIELIAARTTISNGPAILAEHLQRYLNNKRVLEKMGLITPDEAKTMKEPITKKQEIPYLFLCPDCKGTRMWNPDGKGMRPNCPHHLLAEAVKKAQTNGEI